MVQIRCSASPFDSHVLPPHHQGLIEMAERTDLLVHEAIGVKGAGLGAAKVDKNQWRRDAQKGYRGKVTIGQDLDRFTLPLRNKGRGRG